MNIALISDVFPPITDGVSRCVHGCAYALHRKNTGNCTIITPQVPKAVYDYPFPVYAYRSLRIPYGEYRAGYPDIAKITAMMKAMDIDIIHAHSPFISMTIARQIRRRTGIPIVFTQHTKWDYDITRFFSNKTLQNAVERYIYNNINAADEVWAVSRRAGEYICNRGYSGTYKVVRNGTDFPCGKSNIALQQTGFRFDLPGNVPVLLFVGRMVWHKNIGLIIKALSILNKRMFDFRMLFVGDGTDLPAAEKLAEDNGLAGKVCFCGKVSDRELLRAYYTRSDLFVFPSLFDNAPAVIMEAAACCCPSLVVRGSSSSEILEDGVTGFFADETAESIAGAIQEALSDRIQLEKAGEAAFNKVYITWDSIIDELMAYYAQVKETYSYSTKREF